jgi:hypothetical protein
MTEVIEVEMAEEDDDSDDDDDVAEPVTVWLEARVVALGGAAS